MWLPVVEAVHAALFLFLAACVAFVLLCGALGRGGRLLLIAAGAVGLEALVLAAFRWTCPLTLLARRLGAPRGNVADWFLPEWTMPYVFPAFGAAYALGLALLAARGLGRRRRK
jgi:hypothetical protein